MAWLQNLAGKAEDFLNNIDQNAATVLSESSTTPKKIDLKGNYIIEPSKPSPFRTYSPTVELIDEKQKTPRKSQISIISNDSSSPYVSSSLIEEDFPSEPVMIPSYNLFVEQARYELINRLELENQDLNKEILNLQHLFSELKNDHSNLKDNLERANNSAREAQTQMEQYKVRAQRLLQEKEKHDVNPANTKKLLILTNYNEELKKELQFEQEKTSELTTKVSEVNEELTLLQQKCVAVENKNQQSSQNLQQTLLNERTQRANVEEELRIKTKELLSIKIDQHNSIKCHDLEILTLKEKIKQSSTATASNDEETRLHVLTQTLALKQSTLETITSERNALKIQLEKLECTLKQRHKTFVSTSEANDTDDYKNRDSTLDAGVTRRVKLAYSTLDTVSIRTAAFLRRYPVARVFMFCYMILLHVWVIIILLSYLPSYQM